MLAVENTAPGPGFQSDWPICWWPTVL